jgi:hypothetical protein
LIIPHKKFNDVDNKRLTTAFPTTIVFILDYIYPLDSANKAANPLFSIYVGNYFDI